MYALLLEVQLPPYQPLCPCIGGLVCWSVSWSWSFHAFAKNPHKTEFGRVHMRRIYASFSAAYNPHFGNEMSTFTTIKWPHIKKWPTIYTHASASSSHMRPCFSRICGRILISYKVTLPCSNRSTCCKLVFFNQ